MDKVTDIENVEACVLEIISECEGKSLKTAARLILKRISPELVVYAWVLLNSQALIRS